MRKVKDVIVGQILERVTPKNLIIDALSRMESKRIHSVLVFDGEMFSGIVTMTDIATMLFGQNGGYVGDIMTPAEKVVYVDTETSLYACRELMRFHKIHHLVVKDGRHEKVVGVVSSIDLMLSAEEEREEAAEQAGNLPPS